MSNGRLSFVVPTYRLREVGEMVARNYLRGELARDAAMDPHTNVTQGLTRENSLVLQAGEVPDDAIDYVEMALDDEGQTRLEDLNDVYVLVNFRPAVTEQNWHIDCGVTTCATRSRWSSSMRRSATC
jgi:hypothetical protein